MAFKFSFATLLIETLTSLPNFSVEVPADVLCFCAHKKVHSEKNVLISWIIFSSYLLLGHLCQFFVTAKVEFPPVLLA